MARRKVLTKVRLSDFVILIASGHAEIENIFNLTDGEIINLKNKLSGEVITDHEILVSKKTFYEALNNAKSSKYNLKESIDEFSSITFYDLKYKAESLGMIYINEGKNEKIRIRTEERKKEETKFKIWFAVFTLLPILFLMSFCSMRSDKSADSLQRIREICVTAQSTGSSMDGSVDECVERITGG
jgi:hypothetical protein